MLKHGGKMTMKRRCPKEALLWIVANETSLHLSPPIAAQNPYQTEPPTYNSVGLKLARSHLLYCRYYLLYTRMFYDSETSLPHVVLPLSTTFVVGDEDSSTLYAMQIQSNASVENEAAQNIVIKSQYVPLKSNDEEPHYKQHRRCSSSHFHHENWKD